jgi:hypothetical protein
MIACPASLSDRFNGASKSIVCDEDSYFLELVRYIHLNPLRVKLVKNMSELGRYRWCGHSVLMGRIKHSWQDREYVLFWFGTKRCRPRKTIVNTLKRVFLTGDVRGW